MGKLHRTPITRLCEDEAACANARMHSTDQGGALAFGSDSILILELDRSPPPPERDSPPNSTGLHRSNSTASLLHHGGEGGGEGGGGGGGDGGGGEKKLGATATARFYLLQAQLLASSGAGGRAFTGNFGDECLPSGRLQAVGPLRHARPALVAPSLVMP
jgi:hypothetical protein